MPSNKENSLDMVKRFKLGKALELVLHPVLVEDKQYWQYAEGNSDETIAALMGISEKAVSNTRRALFGQFPPAAKRDQALDAYQTDVMNQIRELRSRIDYLERNLGVVNDPNAGNTYGSS